MTRAQLYLLVLSETDEDTPFQGFSAGLIKLAPAILELCRARASVVEGLGAHRALVGRAAGVTGPWLLIAQDSSLAGVLAAVASQDREVFVVASQDSVARVEDAKLQAGVACRTFALSAEGGESELFEFLKESGCAERGAMDEDVSLAGHNVTTPNAVILSSAGARVCGAPFSANSNEPYVAKIVESASHVRRLRRNLGLPDIVDFSPLGINLILAVPGVLHHHAIRRKYDTRGQSVVDAGALRLALKHATQQRDYFNTVPQGSTIFGEKALNLFFSEVSRVRAEELILFTAGLAVLSTRCLAPCVRLPPAVAAAWQERRDLQQVERRAPRKQKTASRLAYDLGKKMLSAVPPEMWRWIDETQGHIKLVSDAPLELMPLGGIPFGIRKTVSRIGVTPGNLYMQAVMPDRPLVLLEADLVKVLVIRSYSEGDSIGKTAELAVSQMMSSTRGAVSVIFVDVADSAEFAGALNAHPDAKIVAFDGHGDLDRETGDAFLVLRNENLSTWALRPLVQRPPAVFFLLACSTHPAYGSHATAANGILSWGVRVVIGTHVPVDASAAAIMFARFVLWIEEYLLPLTRSGTSPFAWAEAFSRFLRRVYVSEFLYALLSKGRISDLEVLRLHGRANLSIESTASWYDAFVEDMSGVLGASTEAVVEMIQNLSYYTDAAKYVQLGRPETILLALPNGLDGEPGADDDPPSPCAIDV